MRLADGSELWSFATDVQPGASFPHAASAHVERVGDRDVVLSASGETLYALDAVTGAEVWRFTAGTGCRDGRESAGPLRLRRRAQRDRVVADRGRRRQASSFGMDVNDVEAGKGGFFAVDVRDGRLRWFFDLESGTTCRPHPGDDIRRFDGYHSEAELGLPAGFLATRPGCDFDRTHTRAAATCGRRRRVDDERGLLYFASSNCDTDTIRRHAAAAAADAAVRRGDRRARLRRHAGLALAPARGRQRRPRLRRRAEPVHDRPSATARRTWSASATRTAPTTCSTATA